MRTRNDDGLTIIRVPGRIAHVVQHLRRMLGAEPIRRPTVDPELLRLGSISRAAEVVRYSTARAEYWLSPGGTLRSVLKHCIKVALLIGLPVLIIGPVILLLLEGATAASASLAAMAANLAAVSISLITAVIGFAVLIAIVRILFRRN